MVQSYLFSDLLAEIRHTMPEGYLPNSLRITSWEYRKRQRRVKLMMRYGQIDSVMLIICWFVPSDFSLNLMRVYPVGRPKSATPGSPRNQHQSRRILWIRLQSRTFYRINSNRHCLPFIANGWRGEKTRQSGVIPGGIKPLCFSKLRYLNRRYINRLMLHCKRPDFHSYRNIKI